MEYSYKFLPFLKVFKETKLRKLGYITVKLIKDPNNNKKTIRRIIHVTKRYIFYTKIEKIMN